MHESLKDGRTHAQMGKPSRESDERLILEDSNGVTMAQCKASREALWNVPVQVLHNPLGCLLADSQQRFHSLSR